MMEACTLCPRACGADRTARQTGRCKSGAKMKIARAALHFWEEPPISGQNGSGAVFFTGCGLRCIYCQNAEISRSDDPPGKTVSPQELSEIFFGLVRQGAHNINLVTATQFLPLVREALSIQKLPVPVVYNTSGYERVETLKRMEGLVDIYLPDFKYAEPALAAALSDAPDYPQTALAAIHEMIRQVGAPVYDETGLMRRGVLIRHLILPGHTKNSIAALKRIKQEFPGVPVSLMAQYTPPETFPLQENYPELARKLTRRELQKVQDVLFELELDGFLQDRTASDPGFLPDFHQYSKLDKREEEV